MTVPRKVSRVTTLLSALLHRPSSSAHGLSRLLSARPVGSVPGRPVPRHGRPRSRLGGRGVVRREERGPHPDLAQRWLRLHEEPGPESGQDERPGEQAGHESGKHLDRPEARFSAALSSECDSKHFPMFPFTVDFICLYDHSSSF